MRIYLFNPNEDWPEDGVAAIVAHSEEEAIDIYKHMFSDVDKFTVEAVDITPGTVLIAHGHDAVSIENYKREDD